MYLGTKIALVAMLIITMFLIVALFYGGPLASYGEIMKREPAAMANLILALLSSFVFLHHFFEDRGFTPPVILVLVAFLLTFMSWPLAHQFWLIGIPFENILLGCSAILLIAGLVWWSYNWWTINALRGDVDNLERRLQDLRMSIDTKREVLKKNFERCEQIHKEAIDILEKWKEAKVTYA
jgi:hypothetical protein